MSLSTFVLTQRFGMLRDVRQRSGRPLVQYARPRTRWVCDECGDTYAVTRFRASLGAGTDFEAQYLAHQIMCRFGPVLLGPCDD